MANIFEYTDFRIYLAEYYAERKASNRTFSYQNFTQKCGFKNKSFLHQVIHSKKQISRSSMYAISKAIGHSKTEAQYFETLVSFNQAKTLDEKNHFYDLLMLLTANTKKHSPNHEISGEYFEYYSKWYHGVIRAYLDMHKFKDEYQLLANTLYPPVPVNEVVKSIRLLEKLQFIKKHTDGYYIVTDKVITTGDEVISTAVLNFHQQSTKLSYEAINRVPREKRNITGLMLGISDNGYKIVCQKISEFRKELLKIAENDPNATHVYQLNLHLFPLTDPDRIR